MAIKKKSYVLHNFVYREISSLYAYSSVCTTCTHQGSSSVLTYYKNISHEPDVRVLILFRRDGIHTHTHAHRARSDETGLNSSRRNFDSLSSAVGNDLNLPLANKGQTLYTPNLIFTNVCVCV